MSIPFTGTYFSPSTFSIVKTSNEASIIRNCFDRASFKKEDGFENGTVTLSGLEDGTYTIRMSQFNIEISLIVHKGVYWLTDSFILK
jgi:hypothetical protein